MFVDRDIPTFMIVVDGNEASEFYASAATPSWTKEGFDVVRFPAITPDWMPSTELRFGVNKADKYRKRNLVKHITPTERAVWWSHYTLWKRCISLNKPIMVLEHDSYLFEPRNLVEQKVGFVSYDHGAMGCYILTPDCAKMLVNLATTETIDSGPLGFILFHSKGKYDMIWVGDKRYRCASNQIYNPKFHTTIDHYGELADKAQELFGTFDYFFVSEHGVVDTNRIIHA